jgi:hypothetical protein
VKGGAPIVKDDKTLQGVLGIFQLLAQSKKWDLYGFKLLGGIVEAVEPVGLHRFAFHKTAQFQSLGSWAQACAPTSTPPSVFCLCYYLSLRSSLRRGTFQQKHAQSLVNNGFFTAISTQVQVLAWRAQSSET